MYIHRVALSVILPQQEPKSEPSSDSIFQPFPAILEEDDLQLRDALASSATPESHGLPERGSKVTQSLPRKLKQKTSEEKSHPHSSIQSDHIVLTKSPKAQRRNLFTKQHSIHEREDSSLTLQDVGGFEVCIYNINYNTYVAVCGCIVPIYAQVYVVWYQMWLKKHTIPYRCLEAWKSGGG